MSKVTREPAPPLRLATTLSGRRVHYNVPVRHQQLTLCREVVYETVTADSVAGRTICASCEHKLGEEQQ